MIIHFHVYLSHEPRLHQFWSLDFNEGQVQSIFSQNASDSKLIMIMVMMMMMCNTDIKGVNFSTFVSKTLKGGLGRKLKTASLWLILSLKAVAAEEIKLHPIFFCSLTDFDKSLYASHTYSGLCHDILLLQLRGHKLIK